LFNTSVEWTVFCRPSPLQENLYNHILTNSNFKTSLFSQESGQHLVYLSLLRKIANAPELVCQSTLASTTEGDIHNDLALLGLSYLQSNPELVVEHENPGTDSDRKVLNPTTSGKLVVLLSLLKEIQKKSEKIVIVSHFTQVKFET
jgi:SNF2 family DNA or RNA helicase